jgi:hypothetical protein
LEVSDPPFVGLNEFSGDGAIRLPIDALLAIERLRDGGP